ncbi:TM2 domain-containing protein [Methylobacterium sp. UNC378MF]|uniref:NINE protein n=1 Tax=Methylobacterium sp. UNC378MF TaxID=1502748 RepID=UPI000887FE5D|nr:NINE protein [Methylobacterium sp. UNC378MF]SDA32563.1 TM2 domain-containing protein [Methylobacterium sp. UNC378MF]
MGRKSGFLAFILWGCGLFLLSGLHRFYVGRFWTGLLWFFTLGLCGVGQLIDLFRLGDMVRVANSEGGGGSSRHFAPANTVAPVFNVTVNAGPAGMATVTPEQIAAGGTQLLSRR